MKTLKYLVFILLLSCCSTKNKTVQKDFESSKYVYSKHFDSLIKQSISTHLEWQKKQSSVVDNLKISSQIELDSLGNRKPFHFKHYVDGLLKEEIYLEGGIINKETSAKQEETQENKQETKQEKTKIDVDVGQKKASITAKITKDKKVEVKGLQFGFYLWLVVLIILVWVSKKLKLPDKIKEILGNRGGGVKIVLQQLKTFSG
ncbi:MAG: hypothetical protein RLZZ292_384 [Bacteroidota bacterium]|jgi:hypothetical protein